MSIAPRVQCPRCGTGFACDPDGSCWCKMQPHLAMPVRDATCWCPDCLAHAQAAAGRGDPDSSSTA